MHKGWRSNKIIEYVGQAFSHWTASTTLLSVFWITIHYNDFIWEICISISEILIMYYFFFFKKESHYNSPLWSGTDYGDQAGFELRDWSTFAFLILIWKVCDSKTIFPISGYHILLLYLVEIFEPPSKSISTAPTNETSVSLVKHHKS